MNWVFLMIVVAGITAVSAWHAYREDDMLSIIITFLGFWFVFCTLIVVVVLAVEIPKNINNFERQKAYIETHVAKNDIEDAALTAKKIELNEWLYDAQLSKSRFGGWSFYPDSIFDLEPIE